MGAINCCLEPIPSTFIFVIKLPKLMCAHWFNEGLHFLACRADRCDLLRTFRLIICHENYPEQLWDHQFKGKDGLPRMLGERQCLRQHWRSEGKDDRTAGPGDDDLDCYMGGKCIFSIFKHGILSPFVTCTKPNRVLKCYY